MIDNNVKVVENEMASANKLPLNFVVGVCNTKNAMDSSINNLSNKWNKMTLNDKTDKFRSTTKVRNFCLKDSYDEEELKLLHNLLDGLKSQGFRTRGPVKKSDVKTRPSPFYKISRNRVLPSRQPQIEGTSSITVTANNGHRAHVDTQNNQGHMEEVPEQDCKFSNSDYEKVLEVLNDQYTLNQLIEDLQSELNRMVAGEAHDNTTLNILGDAQSHTRPPVSFETLNQVPPMISLDSMNFTLSQLPGTDISTPQSDYQLEMPTHFSDPRKFPVSQTSHQSYNSFSNMIYSSNKKIVYSSQNSPSSSQLYIKPVIQHSETNGLQSSYKQDVTDSCYDTGSPSSSSAVTSPGSPYYRSSISSESDQELNFSEPYCVKSVNFSMDHTSTTVQRKAPSKVGMTKTEQLLKPLGKAIHCSTKSAEERLDELSKSAAWKKDYIVQFVRVAISTQKNPNDCVEGFRENLMKTIQTQVEKKHEKIWQLAIFVHLEFLKAPARVQEYKIALLSREREKPLLYVAAIERKCGLVSRYIAEIMHQVGLNPAEEIYDGNNILHKLVGSHDEYAEVLGELLTASDKTKHNKIFNPQCRNKEGKSLLHIAAVSVCPKITTIVLLINNGVDPSLQDTDGKTALHYHLKAMEGRKGCSPWLSTDMELARKLLPPSSVESRKMLDRLNIDHFSSFTLNKIEELKIERALNQK